MDMEHMKQEALREYRSKAGANLLPSTSLDVDSLQNRNDVFEEELGIACPASALSFGRGLAL